MQSILHSRASHAGSVAMAVPAREPTQTMHPAVERQAPRARGNVWPMLLLAVVVAVAVCATCRPVRAAVRPAVQIGDARYDDADVDDPLFQPFD